MKKSRFTESQVIAVLKESDSGMKVDDVCRKHGIDLSPNSTKNTMTMCNFAPSRKTTQTQPADNEKGLTGKSKTLSYRLG